MPRSMEAVRICQGARRTHPTHHTPAGRLGVWLQRCWQLSPSPGKHRSQSTVCGSMCLGPASGCSTRCLLQSATRRMLPAAPYRAAWSQGERILHWLPACGKRLVDGCTCQGAAPGALAAPIQAAATARPLQPAEQHQILQLCHSGRSLKGATVFGVDQLVLYKCRLLERQRPKGYR